MVHAKKCYIVFTFVVLYSVVKLMDIISVLLIDIAFFLFFLFCPTLVCTVGLVIRFL
jgi:hypothetical protein